MAALREAKKLETRQRISTIATALFYERGFEADHDERLAIGNRLREPGLEPFEPPPLTHPVQPLDGLERTRCRRDH